MFDSLTLQPREEPAPTTATERVTRARPDLNAELPEFRAAVLLLLTAEIGYNVDRIMARTRYPREFVARCLRRLVDNGVQIDARLATRWSNEYLATREFWLDVEVALGRYLRRTGEDGRPEWAPAGEWVKNFDFRRGESDTAAANEYHRIEPYDPEPAAPDAEATDAEVSEPDPKPPAPTRPATPRLAIPPRPNPSAPLVESWRGTNWLG